MIAKNRNIQVSISVLSKKLKVFLAKGGCSL